MIPRVTHTRLPEGRQTFKLHAEGEVRLRELTDLTVGPEKLRIQQVPMNLKSTSVALTTLRR